MTHRKIAILGAAEVGKTALAIQFVQKRFSSDYEPTVDDVYHHSIDLDNEHIDLVLADTGGEDDYLSLSDNLKESCSFFLLVYAVDNHESFERIKEFHDDITQKNRTSNIAVVVCGNKSDQDDMREVSKAEGEALASELSAAFFETSALANINVENAFNILIRSIVFRFSDKVMSYPAVAVSTVGTARLKICSDLDVPQDKIQIHRHITEDALPDSEPLSPGIYVVAPFVIASLHCVLSLKPIPSVGSGRCLTREQKIEIDRHAIKTVEDLLNRYFPPSEFPASEPLKVLKDDVELGPSTLLTTIDPDSVLMFECPAAASAVYNFTFSGRKNKTFQVGLDETVADVKSKLFAKLGSGNVFPSVLKLRFWGFELNDEDSIAGLGIPSGAEIELRWNEATPVWATLLDGSRRVYFVTESDQVPSLNGLLAQRIAKDAQESPRKVTSSSA